MPRSVLNTRQYNRRGCDVSIQGCVRYRCHSRIGEQGAVGGHVRVFVVFLVIAAFVWKVFCKRKQRWHRSPSRNAPSVAVDEIDENRSLLDEDEEPLEESEDAENDDNEQEEEGKVEGRWYAESADEEEESNEYIEHELAQHLQMRRVAKVVEVRYGT